MLFILFLVFVVTPIVELAVIVQVAGSTGVLNTIGLLVLVSVVGAWLVRREGLGILRRAQREAAAGRIPGREMIDGMLVLGAGALMLTPGFVTDAVGLALLFPPTRALVRAVVTRRLTRSVASGGTTFTYGWRGDTMPGSGVLDADSWEDSPACSSDEPRQLDD
ncbi:MAG: FxsA family protein [Actinomycetota bacterium]|nr:FxsA family protein [Actinomycetota bacterium]MED5397645.1 FxsA family protein [Actinomycetota bacterium]